MYFEHSSEIWRDFPGLVPVAVFAQAITPDVPVFARTLHFTDLAKARLADRLESELPEIRAWRSAFTAMGLRPTQYRCASESLLRRFRKDGALPRLHPLVDLCNAISLAFAVPIAVFDVSKITGHLTVRHAVGDEGYLTFGGETEHPVRGEVIFCDGARRAHARRWTNRQSGLSAVTEHTSAALIVAEALHATAPADMRSVEAAITGEVASAWPVKPAAALLNRAEPRFTWDC